MLKRIIVIYVLFAILTNYGVWRHFIQTTERAGVPSSLAKEVLAEVAQAADAAITTLEKQLPHGFPEYIHEVVKAGLTERLKSL